MDPRITHRITLHVAAVGAILSGIAFLVVGGDPAIGTLVGSVAAVLNWVALRWLIARLASGETRSKAGVAVLLGLKMAALMAVCYALIARFDVHPVGLAIGLGALPLGVILGASRAASRAEMSEEA
jgi:hypothetical protein